MYIKEYRITFEDSTVKCTQTHTGESEWRLYIYIYIYIKKLTAISKFLNEQRNIHSPNTIMSNKLRCCHKIGFCGKASVLNIDRQDKCTKISRLDTREFVIAHQSF